MELSNPKGMLDYLVRNKKTNPEIKGSSTQVAVVNEMGDTSAQLERRTENRRPQEYEEVIVHPSYLEQKVKIGQSLSGEEMKQLKEFLIQHKDILRGVLRICQESTQRLRSIN